MAKSQPPRMEHRTLRVAWLSAPVLDIARDWMAQRRQMHADLMGSPGVEVTAQECMPAPSLDHLVPSSREPPTAHDRHPFAFLRVTPDGPLELARLLLDATPNDRHVGAAERAVFQLCGQGPMANIVARDDDQARGA